MTWSMTIEEISKYQEHKRERRGRLGMDQPDVYEDTRIQQTEEVEEL